MPLSKNKNPPQTLNILLTTPLHSQQKTLTLYFNINHKRPTSTFTTKCLSLLPSAFILTSFLPPEIDPLLTMLPGPQTYFAFSGTSYYQLQYIFSLIIKIHSVLKIIIYQIKICISYNPPTLLPEIYTKDWYKDLTNKNIHTTIFKIAKNYNLQSQ